MNKLKVLSVFGTRPEASKMSPLLIEFRKYPEIDSICCVSAQHREMLDSMLNAFGVTADIDLDIMEKDQSLHKITTKVLNGFSDVLNRIQPDIVLVHGDTATTFSAALAAFYTKIKVGHVEAGLRSFDKYSPYPEEINRRLCGVIADFHFCPTASNAENLRREGIKDGIFITGNTAIDAVKYIAQPGFISKYPELNALDYVNKRVITVTCHRRENYGEGMEGIFAALKVLAETRNDLQIVYPVHLSPYVRTLAHSTLSGIGNILLLEPLDIIEMYALMSKSYFVMTDSGGLQEEAPALGKPVLVMRRETERQEAIDAGIVKLVGVKRENILRASYELLDNMEAYHKMANATNPYGDGYASKRIAEALLYSFGLSDKIPGQFAPGHMAL